MPEFNALNERFKKQYEDALLHGAHKERRTVGCCLEGDKFV